MKNKRLIRWSYAIAYVILIYSTLSIVRPVCTFLRAHTPFSQLINILVLGVILVGFGYLLWRMRKAPKYLTIASLAIVVVYLVIISRITIPEEKIHFIQYSLLSYLIYRALRLDWKRGKLYFGSLLLTFLFGWGDEGIQYLLPNRYYDLRDVLFNLLGGILGLLMMLIWDKIKTARTPS